MTLGDKIRNMNDDELAKFIMNNRMEAMMVMIRQLGFKLPPNTTFDSGSYALLRKKLASEVDE